MIRVWGIDGYDGVAEAWFESEEELIEAMSASEGQSGVLHYERMKGILSTIQSLHHSLLKNMSFKGVD